MSAGPQPILSDHFRKRLFSFVFVLLLAIAVLRVLLNAFFSTEPQIHYLLQADAFLHGRLDIQPSGLVDLAIVNGRAYAPFPPAPALLLLPFVAIFGVAHVNLTLFGLGLAVVTVWVLHRLLRHLEVDPDLQPWLLLAFLLGTGYWFALIGSANVWMLAHIVAILFMLLALSEATGSRRPWLVGVFLSFAFLSRQLSLSLVPLAAVLLAADDPRRRRARDWAGFILPMIVAGVAYLLYNAARFGSPFDSGYSHIALTGFLAERVAQHGLFSLSYLPFNIAYLFLQGWHLNFGGPLMLEMTGADPFGTSLLAASPFLLAACWAVTRRRVRWAAWLGIGAATLVMLLYYNNGWIQINTQRFTLDILPALFYLTLRGAQRWPARLFRGTIAYAVALNVLTLVIVPFLA